MKGSLNSAVMVRAVGAQTCELTECCGRDFFPRTWQVQTWFLRICKVSHCIVALNVKHCIVSVQDSVEWQCSQKETPEPVLNVSLGSDDRLLLRSC